MNHLLIEYLGTLFFLYVIITTGNPIAIGASLAIAVLLGNGDYNPVVTLVNLVSGKLSTQVAVPHMLAQLAGGLSALELAKL